MNFYKPYKAEDYGPVNIPLEAGKVYRIAAEDFKSLPFKLGDEVCIRATQDSSDRTVECIYNGTTLVVKRPWAEFTVWVNEVNSDEGDSVNLAYYATTDVNELHINGAWYKVTRPYVPQPGITGTSNTNFSTSVTVTRPGYWQSGTYKADGIRLKNGKAYRINGELICTVNRNSDGSVATVAELKYTLGVVLQCYPIPTEDVKDTASDEPEKPDTPVTPDPEPDPEPEPEPEPDPDPPTPEDPPTE